MDAIDLLRYQTKLAYSWLEMTVSDVTEDQANWQPAGIANPIGATYAHIFMTADEDFNIHLKRRNAMHSSGDWSGRIGLSEMPVDEFDWDWHDWAASVRVDWDTFRTYAKAVEARVLGYTDTVTLDELAAPVDMSAWGLDWKGLDVYLVHGVNHIFLHGGPDLSGPAPIRIGAGLKGLQNAPAWTTGWDSGLEKPI